jgi:flagellar biosynthesis/type III secretory pathway M-ring protein FliF/YscJ
VTPVAEASDSQIDLWIIILIAVVILIIIIVLILVCRRKGEQKADQGQLDKARKGQYSFKASGEEAEDKTENNDEEAAINSGFTSIQEPV